MRRVVRTPSRGCRRRDVHTCMLVRAHLPTRVHVGSHTTLGPRAYAHTDTHLSRKRLEKYFSDGHTGPLHHPSLSVLGGTRYWTSVEQGDRSQRSGHGASLRETRDLPGGTTPVKCTSRIETEDGQGGLFGGTSGFWGWGPPSSLPLSTHHTSCRNLGYRESPLLPVSLWGWGPWS